MSQHGLWAEGAKSRAWTDRQQPQAGYIHRGKEGIAAGQQPPCESTTDTSQTRQTDAAAGTSRRLFCQTSCYGRDQAGEACAVSSSPYCTSGTCTARAGAGTWKRAMEEGQWRPWPRSKQHPLAPGEKHSTLFHSFLLFSILYFSDHILTLVTALKGCWFVFW